MKLLKYTILLTFCIIMSCKESKNEAELIIEKTNIKVESKVKNKATKITLKPLWKTEKTLITAEAVKFNSNKNVIYVSNIGAVPPNAKDGDGSLSILDTNGKIINQNWVTGLNAPKGIGIFNNKLYVADIDLVVKIDIETGRIEQHIKIEGAQFLNDIAIDKNGNIYVTDTNGNTIYKIENNKVTVWKTFKNFNPNGILIEENSIVVVSYSNGNLIAIDKKTKEEILLAKNINGGDGIVSIANGYIVSNWAGEIYFAAKKLKGAAATKILDTKEAKINAADIAIIPDKNILLIPTFFANTVNAYKIIVEK